jgi:hypothetical protein
MRLYSPLPFLTVFLLAVGSGCHSTGTPDSNDMNSDGAGGDVGTGTTPTEGGGVGGYAGAKTTPMESGGVGGNAGTTTTKTDGGVDAGGGTANTCVSGSVPKDSVRLALDFLGAVDNYLMTPSRVP